MRGCTFHRGYPLILFSLCGVLSALPARFVAKAVAAPPTPRVQIKGVLIDPEEKLRAAIDQKEGCKGLDPAARKRVAGTLDSLGYKVLGLDCSRGRLTLNVRPWRVIRKIYIKGNWPLFEEEILRRLRFRPGQRLPEGEAFERAKAREEERMKLYLSREGYFDGSLVIHPPRPTSTRHEVNLHVRVMKGRRYKVGEVVAIPAGASGRARRRERDEEPFAISRGEIAKVFRHKIWFYKMSFNTKRFNEDVEKLVKKFHKKGYPGVRVKKSFEVVKGRQPSEAVRIRLRIQQRKRIEIEYQGNVAISKKELNAVLTIYEAGAYDDYELAQSSRKIHRLYQSKGYLQARVSFTRKVGRRQDWIVFKINEGPRFRVKEVQFAGNRSIAAEELRKTVKTRPFPWLGYIGLGEGGYVTQMQLEQDVERLENLYRERGFPEVQVTGELSPDPRLLGRPGALAAAVGAGTAGLGKLYVRFTIKENTRAAVERVHIDGNRVIDSETLLAQLALKPGRAFTTKALALDKARLAQIYGERGYPHAEVRSFEELNPTGTKVTVQLTVQENDPVRFGPVFIRGNFKTRTSVIMRDLDFKQGDLFDIRKIEQSEARLRKRQIFNVVRVQLLGIGTRRSEVPVLVQVEERYDDHGAIEFGVGGSTDNLIFGSLAYTNRNLLGFGTSVSLMGEVGMRIQSGKIHYRDPRLFGSTIIFDAQGYIRNQITERLGEVLTFGGTLSLTRELVPHLKGLVSYEIRRVKHKDELNRPAGVEEARQVDVFTQTAGVGSALIYDRRDNPLNPSRGFRLQGSVLWATRYLGGTNDFIKFNASGQAFIPLPKEITIAFSVRYDHAIPLAGALQLPKVERYYAGGDTTIRGLEQDMAWTEVEETELMPLGGTLYHVKPQGGNIRLLTNFEVQFPIWKESILFGLPLMGAVFFDNGMVTNSFEGFEMSDFRHGLGFAWRLVTPVGFFSVAFPTFLLDPGIGDEIWRVHFNFGFVF